MPLSRDVARFNRAVSNRLIRPLAAHLPAMAVIVHRGRVSGQEYRTPVNCWHDGETAIVALTYGPDTDWLANLKAAGGGAMINRGDAFGLGAPELIGEQGMARMPWAVRQMLGWLDVDEFAVMPLVRTARPS